MQLVSRAAESEWARPSIRHSARSASLPDDPRTEVYFADTYDELEPMGAKSMSETPFNPVAPALANAVRNAHRGPAAPAASVPRPHLAPHAVRPIRRDRCCV